MCVPKFGQILKSQTPLELKPKFGQILQLDKPTYYSNFKTRHAYLLQQSSSQTPLELEPKFGQMLQQDKPTYYSTNPRQKFDQIFAVALLLTTAKIWSKVTRQAYLILHTKLIADPLELAKMTKFTAKIWLNITRQAYLLKQR